ncbi:fimbrial protein, partial [Escherichia coli]|nr:fimbrial protein [Escherichia coli]
PQTGSLAQANQQVFSNQYELQSIGAKNVGVVISSAQPHAQKFNVRGTDGASKAIYALPSNQAVPSTWTFYARMQKVNNALAPVAGIVRSQVIVNV